MRFFSHKPGISDRLFLCSNYTQDTVIVIQWSHWTANEYKIGLWPQKSPRFVAIRYGDRCSMTSFSSKWVQNKCGIKKHTISLECEYNIIYICLTLITYIWRREQHDIPPIPKKKKKENEDWGLRFAGRRKKKCLVLCFWSFLYSQFLIKFTHIFNRYQHKYAATQK